MFSVKIPIFDFLKNNLSRNFLCYYQIFLLSMLCGDSILFAIKEN
jgi:hypothetical protein